MPTRRISLLSLMPLLGFGLFFIVAMGAVVIVREEPVINVQLRHTLEVDDDLLRIQSLLVDAESAQRGYLLTGQLSYLEPYNLAKHALPGELRALQSELEKSSAPDFDALNIAVARKLANLQEVIDLRAANKPEATLAVINNDSDSKLFGLAKQSGGHVKIYSEPGKGTAVKVYLPRYRRPPKWRATTVRCHVSTPAK